MKNVVMWLLQDGADHLKLTLDDGTEVRAALPVARSIGYAAGCLSEPAPEFWTRYETICKGLRNADPDDATWRRWLAEARVELGISG